ncbi:type II toxin-antitoxin system HicA family toxin [Sodalinema gerasimenkoae]|uniref:type II toxin-antitoxin system HicA family toxin n=1 Tax=Sodalinema gerasimenkoae TaxID=2862348 RepID=UPI00135CAA9B|nr:type II toxin-antitoxin system HicA family toxin [Sodalinema gerasimenkoae]
MTFTFLRRHRRLLLHSLGRLGLISLTAFGIASIFNWTNHRNYWQGTIFSVQTVDFNLLTHTLPSKLSYLLIEGESAEIQRTLESHYGFFGLVMTDCRRETPNCPEQTITYFAPAASSMRTSPTVEDLANAPFDVLRDPPPRFAEWSYESSRDRYPVPTGQTNPGEVIGRVYYLRGQPSQFLQDYWSWLRNPSNLEGSRFIYFVTTLFFLVGGTMTWVIIELILYSQRKQRQELEEDAQFLKQQLQQELDKIPQLLEERESVRSELESYRQQQQQLTQNLQGSIADYEQQLKELQDQEQERQQTLETLEADLKAAIDSQTEAQELIEERERKITELKQHQQDQERKRQERTQILEQLRHDLELTQESALEAQAETETLNQIIAELTRDRNLAQEQYQKLQAKLSQQLDNSTLKQALESSRNELQHSQQQAEKRELQLLQENSKLKRDVDERTEYNETFEILAVEQSEFLNQEIQSLKTEIESLKGTIALLEQQNNESFGYQIHLKDRIQQLEELEESIKSIEDDDNESETIIHRIMFSEMPQVSGKDVIKSLKKMGFTYKHTRGSHARLEKTDTRSCTVPIHSQPLRLGTLRNILINAGVTVEDLKQNL